MGYFTYSIGKKAKHRKIPKIYLVVFLKIFLLINMFINAKKSL